MADEQDQQDRTEEATPERRQEFRDRGQIPVSKEITSVFILAMFTGFFSLYITQFLEIVLVYMGKVFRSISSVRMDEGAILHVLGETWIDMVTFITPFFLVTALIAISTTFFQTRMNWSWKKLAPEFGRLNPLKGIMRIVGKDMLMELVKGVLKLLAVGIVSFLILKSEWVKVPSLITFNLNKSWLYWADITETLFYSVSGILLLVGGLDYVYNFRSLEKQMMMTKEEVKEEFKNREVDQQVKSKIKRMQRDLAMSQAVQAVPKATVVITNPEHYAIAVLYELGMPAPIVLAKGIDHIAQQMKITAKENEVPIVENKPLARTLYKLVDAGQHIPESLYKAVSEVIRYVFLLKGKKLTRS